MSILFRQSSIPRYDTAKRNLATLCSSQEAIYKGAYTIMAIQVKAVITSQVKLISLFFVFSFMLFFSK